MSKIFNRAIVILLATNGLIQIAGAMLGPIYAIFVEEIGGNLLDASYSFAIYTLVGGIITLIAAKFSDDMINSEYIIILGYVIIGIGFLGYMLVSNIWGVYLVQAVIGAGKAIYGPAFDALFTKHTDKGRVAKQWGSWEALWYFSATFGAVTGGLLVARFGFDPVFALMAVLCFISAGYLFFLPREVI